MTVAVITGGRDHWPTLAELERLLAEVERRRIIVVRHGDARGLDRTAGGYLKARGITVDAWPADWTTHKRAAGAIRNRAMLDGDPPDLLGTRARVPASILFAFKGGKGTADCRAAAIQRGLEVVDVWPRREPRIWNMHHRWYWQGRENLAGDVVKAQQSIGKPPGLVYVGRSREWGGPSPLANPVRLELQAGETRASAALRNLEQYRQWLWARMQAGDRDVLEALDAITPDSFLGCTCWPMHCHAEVIVRAWRYRNRLARLRVGET